jgi:hypothetical protein
MQKRKRRKLSNRIASCFCRRRFGAGFPDWAILLYGAIDGRLHGMYDGLCWEEEGKCVSNYSIIWPPWCWSSVSQSISAGHDEDWKLSKISLAETGVENFVLHPFLLLGHHLESLSMDTSFRDENGMFGRRREKWEIFHNYGKIGDFNAILED